MNRSSPLSVTTPRKGQSFVRRGLDSYNAALAAVVIAGWVWLGGPASHGTWAWLVVAAVMVLTERLPAVFALGKSVQATTLTECAVVLGLWVCAPRQLLLARALATVIARTMSRRRRRSLRLDIFNGLLGCVDTVTFLLLARLLETRNHGFASAWWRVMLGLLLMDAVNFVIYRFGQRIQNKLDPLRVVVRPRLVGIAAVEIAGLVGLVVAIANTVWPYAWLLALPGLAGLLAIFRLSVAMNQRRMQLDELADLSNMMATATRTPNAIDDVLREIGRALHANEVRLVYRKGDVFRERHLNAGKTTNRTFPFDELGEPWTETLLNGDVTRGIIDAKPGIIVTLRGDVGPFGLLAVGDPEMHGSYFTKADEKMLRTIGDQAATWLLNLRLVEELQGEVREREFLAFHDHLTGLANRRGMEIALTHLRETGGALLLIDVDRFKQVNDVLGHAAGDELLRVVGARLAETLPEGTVIARLGGDEFAAMVPQKILEPTTLLRHVRELLCHPTQLQGLDVDLSASLGLALCPEHGEEGDELLRHADLALYRAKQHQSGFELYSPAVHGTSREQLELRADLARVVERDELVLRFQPKVDLASGRPVAVEALVRWQHPQHGIISPDLFIDIAEQSPLIGDITLRVAELAAEQMIEWDREEISLNMSINISPRCLLDPELMDRVAEVFIARSIRPERVTMELTEGAMMHDPKRSANVLRHLAVEHGFRISIDDFGVGFSSLAYLRDLPVYEIKVDRTFVKDMVSEPTNDAIVRTVIELGHNLGMIVTAEGVSDEPTLLRLRAIGCDQAQGFLLSAPIKGNEIPAWCNQFSPPEPDGATNRRHPAMVRLREGRSISAGPTEYRDAAFRSFTQSGRIPEQAPA